MPVQKKFTQHEKDTFKRHAIDALAETLIKEETPERVDAEWINTGFEKKYHLSAHGENVNKFIAVQNNNRELAECLTNTINRQNDLEVLSEKGPAQRS